jgi:pentatricopeptide repeat domain-containing protein 1
MLPAPMLLFILALKHEALPRRRKLLVVAFLGPSSTPTVLPGRTRRPHANALGPLTTSAPCTVQATRARVVCARQAGPIGGAARPAAADGTSNSNNTPRRAITDSERDRDSASKDQPQPQRRATPATPASASAAAGGRPAATARTRSGRSSPQPRRRKAAASDGREQRIDSGVREAILLASRLRKAGDVAGAEHALAPHDPSTSTYVELLNESIYVRQALAHASGRRSLDVFDDVVRFARASRALPNSRTYNALLFALRTDDPVLAPVALKRAIDLYRQMRASGIEPDEYTLSLLVQHAAAAGDVDATVMLRDEMLDSLNVISGTALVAAFAKCGDAARAQETFDQLVESGVQVNERTFAAVISAFYRAGLHGKVISCMDRALASADVRPNVYVFSGALTSCARTGDTANARRYFETMLQLGVRITEQTLNCVLDAAVRGGDLALAQEVLYDWMHNRRVTPARDQVNKVIALCGRVGVQGRGGEHAVLDMLSNMTTKLGVKPDLGTYNVAVSALARTKNMITARRLVEQDMPAAGLKPNVLTYNSLIHACGVVGKVHTSFELLHHMRLDPECQPNQVTYNTILEQCTQANEPWLVSNLLEEMDKTRGIIVGVSAVTSLLQMYRSERDAASAVQLYRKFVRAPGAPRIDNIMYNSVLSIALEHGLESDGIGIAGKLFVDRRADAGTYNSLIFYVGQKKRDAEWASRLLEHMKIRGIAPDDVTYATLIRVYAINGKLEGAFRILGEMQDVGLGCTDSFAWTTLISACGRAGQWQRALEVLEYMRSGGRGEGRTPRGLIPLPTTSSYNAAIYAAGMVEDGWDAALRVFHWLESDPSVAADSVTYSAMASSILKHMTTVTEWDVVEEVTSGLEYCAEAIRDEIEGGNHDPSLKRSLKRMTSKRKRLSWLMSTLKPLDESGEEIVMEGDWVENEKPTAVEP